MVRTVADRLRAGQTVVAFPEGTTWCGLGYGAFRPAMFQAAIDAGRPVQPLRLTLSPPRRQRSTVPAFVGDDTLLQSIRRVITAQLDGVPRPGRVAAAAGDDRRDLSARCEAAVRGTSVPTAGRRTRRLTPLGGTHGRDASNSRPGCVEPVARLATHAATAVTGPVRRPVSWHGHAHRLPRSRRHHPDAPRCHRGDDGCAGDGRQRVVAARLGPRGAPPDGGGARGAGRACSARARRRSIFTAGGTESDNLAVKGIYWARRDADPRRRRIVTTPVEHHAVLDAVQWLVEHEGAEVTWLPVDADGSRRAVRATRSACRPTTTWRW